MRPLGLFWPLLPINGAFGVLQLGKQCARLGWLREFTELYKMLKRGDVKIQAALYVYLNGRRRLLPKCLVLLCTNRTLPFF